MDDQKIDIVGNLPNDLSNELLINNFSLKQLFLLRCVSTLWKGKSQEAITKNNEVNTWLSPICSVMTVPEPLFFYAKTKFMARDIIEKIKSDKYLKEHSIRKCLKNNDCGLTHEFLVKKIFSVKNPIENKKMFGHRGGSITTLKQYNIIYYCWKAYIKKKNKCSNTESIYKLIKLLFLHQASPLSPLPCIIKTQEHSISAQVAVKESVKNYTEYKDAHANKRTGGKKILALIYIGKAEHYLSLTKPEQAKICYEKSIQLCPEVIYHDYTPWVKNNKKGFNLNCSDNLIYSVCKQINMQAQKIESNQISKLHTVSKHS